MASVELTHEQYKLVWKSLELTRFLSQKGRIDFLKEDADLNWFYTRINYDTDLRLFVSQLVRALQQYGTLATTKEPALATLLKKLRDEIAIEKPDVIGDIDEILAPYQTAPSSHE